MALVGLTSVMSVGYLWVSSEKNRFDDEKVTLKQAYINQQKDQLKHQVDSALNVVSHKRSQMEIRLKASIQSRVYEAHAIATHIYKHHRSSLTLDEIKERVKEALRPIRFNHGRGYYFAFDLNGVETLFPVQPDMEGRNMLDVHGGNGNRVVFDMLNRVKESGEAFYRYTWEKPGAKGFHPKIAYAKIVEPLGWVIGTGEYVNDVEKDIQKESLAWISNIRFGDGGYVFVGQYDGLSLSGPQAGKNMFNVEDVNGVKIVQELIHTARNGGGFVHYILPKFDGQKQAPKLSYSAGIDAWEWYVGSGIYVDQIDRVLETKEAALHRRIRHNLMHIAGVLLVITLCVVVVIGLLTRRIQNNVMSFMAFFDRAASRSTKIDETSLHYKEFINLAHAANTMIDERKRMEEDLHQARKMEAVGNLAGGIAHEFNNILTIILGNVELILDEPDLPAHFKGNLEQIHTSGLRARDVVRQLLNFSRKGITRKAPLSMADAVREFLVLLKASLPASIFIRDQLDDHSGCIMADKTQIHQVLMNICNNAFQAMEINGGGILTVELERSALALPKDIPPGEYIRLIISDTGKGIPEDFIDKIFDPYFTTKETGKGTGLGLAVVAGIIKDHQGFIRVEKTSENGTTFHIYFPVCGDAPPLPEEKGRETAGGHETILVLDDEVSIAKMLSLRLEKMGYTVITEFHPLSVLEKLKSDPSCCDLVISDMSMPYMDGDALAKELLTIRPGLPIIVCTGYTDKLTPEKARETGIKQVFDKPVDLSELCAAIRTILG